MNLLHPCGEASKKDLFSFIKSPFITSSNLVVISSGDMSVKNPTLPKLIPNIGIPWEPYLLEQFSMVPSPPIAIKS